MLEFLNQNAGALTVMFTAVVTLSTVVYAILTAALVKETRRMRQAQTEPKIEITLRPSDEWINLIRLHLKNIGIGPAYDLSLRVRPETSSDGANALISDFTKANFFNTGLKYLGPGQEIISGYTQMTGALFDLKISSVLLFDVEYRDAIGKQFNETFRIDFSEFKGRSQIGTPHLYAIAKAIEKIEKNIDHIATGWKKVKIDVYNSADREKEERDWKEYTEKQMREKDKASEDNS